MKTLQLSRLSISIHKKLLRQFDDMMSEKGYSNRSQAISDLIRDSVIDHGAALGNEEIAGTVTLVYDHHRPDLLSKLTKIQHDHGEIIISSLHVHLDHHNCMEVLAVRGPSASIRKMADGLVATRGVKHGKLTVTTTGREFA